MPQLPFRRAPHQAEARFFCAVTATKPHTTLFMRIHPHTPLAPLARMRTFVIANPNTNRKTHPTMRTVNYSVVARKNPADIESGEVKYYATAQAKGTTGIDEIAERISHATTVTRADCLAVLAALEEQISDCLQSGEIVKLGDIGTFRISIGSSGSDTEETFTVALIKTPKVVFLPSQNLKKQISSLNFTKVKTKKQQEEDAGEGV